MNIVSTSTLGGGNLLFLFKWVLFPFIASKEFHEMFGFSCFSCHPIHWLHFKNVQFNLNANTVFFLVTKPVSFVGSFFYLFSKYSCNCDKECGSEQTEICFLLSKQREKLRAGQKSFNFRQGWEYLLSTPPCPDQHSYQGIFCTRLIQPNIKLSFTEIRSTRRMISLHK